MQTKQIAPMHLLYFSTETKVTDMEQYVGVIGDRLVRDAVENNLRIIGPQYWLYDGFEGTDKLFTLEIAYPIERTPEAYNGRYAIKTTPNFNCISTLHNGHWQTMPETYGQLMSYLHQSGRQPTARNREIYIHADMVTPENMVTEVQIGIE